VERPIYTDPPNYGLEGSGGGFLSGGSGTGIEELPFEAIKITPDPIIIEAKLNTRYSRQFQPGYPSGQLRLGEEGVVSVRVLVGANGRAKRLELISTPHRDFWNSTRRHALKKWRFKPATKGGKPYESWITLKVRFTINS
jgi:protein TonB